MDPLLPEHITIYAKSNLAQQMNERLAWPVDILIGETTVVQDYKLNDPLTSAEKEECRWYLEKFVSEAPYSTARAQKAAKTLKSYAEALQQDLNLLGHITDTDCSLSNQGRTLVIEIKEDPLNGKTSLNSIHQLHWELLEERNLWSQNIIKVQVRRGITGPPPKPSTDITPTISACEQDKCFNVLLVIARDTSRGRQKPEIDPNCASAILTAVQRSVNAARRSVKINLEIVRPGTLDSLEQHLARAENRHHPGYFHLVHFDLHGSVSKKRKAVLNFSRQNSEGEVLDKTTGVDANLVAKILQKYAVGMVVLNACESARANCGDDSNVAKIFGKHGIKNIIAMSFKVFESALKVFLPYFYQGLLLDGLDFPTAASNARDMLRQQSDREARFNLKRPLLDWFIPVSYCYGPLQEPLFQAQTHDTPPIKSATSQTTATDDNTPIQANLVGRDFDILRLEKRLLGQSFENGKSSAMKVLYLYGIPGVGKSAFLKNLRSLWRSTSFVDVVIYMDFAVISIPSREAFITQLLAQLPHDKSTVNDAPADTVVAKEQKVLQLFQRLRFALILDGIHVLTTVEPDQAASIATSGINEFLMELVKSQQESTNEPRGFCVIVGRSQAKPHWLDVWSSMASLELMALEHPLSGDFLRATILHEHADIGNNQETRRIDYFELLAKLLQGIPAALLCFGNLARVYSYSAAQLYEMVHSGYPSKELLLHLDYGLGGIFKELEHNFNNSPESLLPVLITLGWYWHEGPPTNLFREMLTECKICLFESEIDRALELASKWGYIDLGSGDKIEWIHPLFTIYCRMLACSKDQSLTSPTIESWESFYKSFASKVMGHVQREPRNLVSISKESPGGLHDAVQFLTTSLSSELLRELNFPYFLFTQKLMSGIDSPINPVFQIPLSRRNPVAKPEEILRLGQRGLQNILFVCKICMGGGPTALPVSLWPELSFNFYGMNFRKVATNSEIRIVAEMFEKLLEKSVHHSQASRGGPFYEYWELGCILSLSSSLATIHSKYIELPSSEGLKNQISRKFVELGEDVLHQSEKKYGSASSPGVLQPKSMLFIAKAELFLAEGKEKEADAAWAVMLESGKGAMEGMEAMLSSKMIPKEIVATQNPRFVFDQMWAWYNSLDKVWDIFKRRVRGERFEMSQMEKTSLVYADPESSLVDLLFKLQSTDVQYGEIERALEPGGNPLAAAAYHKNFMIDAMASLDIGEAGDHLGAIANILSQDPSSAAAAENIRIVKEGYAKEGSLQQFFMSGQQPDSTSVKPTWSEMVDDEISILKKTAAPPQAIKYLETMKDTFKDTDRDSLQIRLQDPETRESVQKFMQSYLPRLTNERTKEKALNALLETLILYQGIEKAEKDGDYRSTIDVIDRAERLRGPDGMPELVKKLLLPTAYYRLLLTGFRKITASLRDDMALEKVEQIRADLSRLVAELKKVAPLDSDLFSSNHLTNLCRSLERTYFVQLTSEADAARQRRDHSKCFADLEKFFSLVDSGSLSYSDSKTLEDSISFARNIKFLARIEQAVMSKNWKAGVTCCQEWEKDYKSLWKHKMDSSDGPVVRDMRDTCELSYYV